MQLTESARHRPRASLPVSLSRCGSVEALATEELAPEERTRQLCRSATSPGHSSSVSIMVACSPSRVRSGGRG